MSSAAAFWRNPASRQLRDCSTFVTALESSQVNDEQLEELRYVSVHWLSIG